MNLCEAIKSGLPIRRKTSARVVGSNGDGWVDPAYFVSHMQVAMEDLIADDWEVQEREVVITASVFWKAYADFLKGWERGFAREPTTAEVISGIAMKLCLSGRHPNVEMPRASDSARHDGLCDRPNETYAQWLARTGAGTISPIAGPVRHGQ